MTTTKYPIGLRVVVCDGSGLASSKTGHIVAPFDWHSATDGTFYPPGKNQVPVRYDDGILGFMYKNRLSKEN